MLGGCVTSANPSGASASDERAARNAVESAKQVYENSNYHMAVPRLQDILMRYRDTKAADEALYLLGKTYQRMGSSRDAMALFDEYLRIAPNGLHTAACQQSLNELDTVFSKQFATVERMNQTILDLRASLKQTPDSAIMQFKLANLLWQRGNYDESGKLYASLVLHHSQYADNEIIHKRIEWLPENQYIVLTPAEVLLRDAQNTPLIISNESTFRMGEDYFTRGHTKYAVTGQVTNRGDSVLYGVQVFVTIMGMGNVIYDSRTIGISRLIPGETRAFSVTFSNFPNIENIIRHECVATFQR